MDPFPQEHYRGSGGVCDNCQHNTAGESNKREWLVYFTVTFWLSLVSAEISNAQWLTLQQILLYVYF